MAGYELSTVVALAAIVFVSFMIRGMSGFGTSLIAIPLMVYVVPIHMAVPLMALLGLGLLLMLGVRDRAHVGWSEVWRLTPPTILGVVVGVWVFSLLDARVMLKLLGLFIVGYAIWMIASDYLRVRFRRWPGWYAWPFGFTQSFVDSMFGGGGGVLAVIYMHRRGFDKIGFRSTLAVVWVGELLLRVGGYAVGGYYDGPFLALAAVLLPVMYAATRVGEMIADRMSQQAFSRLLAVLLVASGGSLLFK